MWSDKLHFLPSMVTLRYAFHSGFRHFFLSLSMLLLFQFSSHAQLRRSERSWSLSLQGGISGYYGDLSPRNSGAWNQYFSGIRSYGGLSLEKRISGHLSLSGNFAYNQIYGSDYEYSPQGSSAYLRNLHFRNQLYSLYLMGQWDFTPLFGRYSDRKVFRPYVAAGIGVVNSSPEAKEPLAQGGRWVDLRPLGTEGQLLDGGHAYAQWAFQAPVELGLHIRLNRWIDIVPHIRYHFSFTDYLDDVSGAYVDAGLLADPLAQALSDRSTEPIDAASGGLRELQGFDAETYTGENGNTYTSYHGFPQSVSRGDGNSIDRYWSAGVKLRFYLSGSPKESELSKLHKIHDPVPSGSMTRRIVPDAWVRSQKRHRINRLEINTPYSEVPSCFYQDGFLISSDRPEKRAPKGRRLGNYYNIYYTPFADIKRGEITKPIHIRGEEGLEELNQLQGALLGKEEAFFAVAQPLKAHRESDHFRLYQAEVSAGLLWEDSKPVTIENWEGSVAQPAFNQQRDTLVFVSEGEEGYGGTDLFFSVRKDSTWSTPQNMGMPFNTSGNELYPFLHQDGSIYFASDGHPGFGGLDIFEARKDGAGEYIIANLGSPVNSKYNDFALIIDRIKRRGYFASDRSGGKGSNDIYSLSVAQLSKSRILTSEEDLVQERLITVEGLIIDEWSERPIPNAYVTVDNEISQKMRVYSSNDKGIFSFQASNDGLYRLSGNAIGYQRFEEQPLDSLGVENSLTGDYEVRMAMKPEESQVIIVKGTVMMAGGETPLSGASVQLKIKGDGYEDRKEVRVSSEGMYKFRLQRNLHYEIIATKEGFTPASYEFSTQNRISQRIVVNLKLEQASE